MTAKYAADGVFGQLLSDPHFWAPTVAMGAGLAAGGIASVISKMTAARDQARSYKEMVNLHPTLQQRDGALVKRIYSSLHNVNPMMAKDPMVAGAWVDTIIESGGLDAGQAGRALLEGVKDLAQIRSQVSQARKNESNVGHQVGSNVEKIVAHGFERGHALEREHGELAQANKALEDVKNQKTMDYAKQVTKGLMHAGNQHGMDPNSLIQAVAQGAFKTSSDEGRRLLDAVRG